MAHSIITNADFAFTLQNIWFTLEHMGMMSTIGLFFQVIEDQVKVFHFRYLPLP